MSAPFLPVRTERTTAARGQPAPSRGSEPQGRLGAQHQAFDFEVAERAEILREHEALTALLMEHLKNEDEVMKKWIALI